MATRTADNQDSELAEARSKWISRLDDEQEAHKQYRSLAKDANAEYFAVSCGSENSSNEDTRVAYPLFWSIVNVLHGRIFSQPPTPDVRKRYIDEPAKQPVIPPPVMGAPAAGPAPPLPPQPGQPPAPVGAAPGQQPAAPPQPTVDDNKIAECIERALSWVVDNTSFDADGHGAVNDLLVVGAGVAKIEIDVETTDIPVTDPTTGEDLPELDEEGSPVMGEDGSPKLQMQTVITDQSVRLRHFDFAKQFHWEPQQHWSQVSWVGFDHWMTSDEIEDTWGVTLSTPGAAKRGNKEGGGSGLDEKKPQSDKYARLFRVTEIWNKADRTVIYVCPNHDEAFEIRPDPLKLKDFFPCPKPMMLNIKGDDLVPQPDYSKCESLFKTANEFYGRIDALTRQIKDVGFYDSAFGDLAKLMTADDGSLIPISNLFAQLAALNPGNQQLGFNAVVFKQDNSEKVKTIAILMQQMADIEDKIWKSYGVSDIQRGSTNPDETATAQNIKAQWADIRVGQRIRIVALFFRDVFRIMADIIATFKPETIYKMTGIQLNPDELAILQSDLGRLYAVDIESDSTAAQDESAQQSNRMNFTNAMTNLLKELGPLMAQNQIPADLGKELILVVCNAFKVGRQIEDSIDNLPSTMQQLQTLTSQVQQGLQQGQQLQQQLQKQGQQLSQVNMQEEARKNARTQMDAQKTQADTGKTVADTEHTQVQTALDAQQIAHQAASPHPGLTPPLTAPPNRGA